MASILKVDKLDPQSGTALEIGTSGDTVTVPSGVGLTLTDSTLLLPTTITSTTEVKTNKISPATGAAFALGDSGDTFTVPSGATIVNSGTATGFGGGKVVKVTTALPVSATSNSTDTPASHVSQAHTMESSSNGLIVMGIGDVGRGTGAGGIQVQVYDGVTEKAVSRLNSVADNDSIPIPSFYDGGYSGEKTWHVYVTSTTDNAKATINAGHGIVFIEVDTS